MRTGLILVCFALAIAPALAGGDSGYTGYLKPEYRHPQAPAPVAQPDYMNSCRKTIAMAEDGLDNATGANRAHAQADIERAHGYMSAGNGFSCTSAAHDAMSFEH